MENSKHENNQQWEPKIICFVCNWCTYTGADLAGTSRLKQQPNARLIRLPCTGRIDPLFIIKAFESGADGVLVSGCHPGDCHYNTGNYHARRRWIFFRELMNFVGIDESRLQFSWVSASEGKKWVDTVDGVINSVRNAGPFVGYEKMNEVFSINSLEAVTKEISIEATQSIILQ